MEEREQRLLPLSAMARRLHVTAKWLQTEALAGRIPHIEADTRLLFNPKVVERLLWDRAAELPTDRSDDPERCPDGESGE